MAERFAGLPLALATAGAYLRKSTFSYEQYLQEYTERWNLDEKRPLKLQEYRERTLYTTWNQSYARLKNDDPDAAWMLKLLAYFDNQSIWFELLRTVESHSSPNDAPDALSDRICFESTMRVLLDYSFVEINTDAASYSMHNCVQDWALGELNKIVDTQKYLYAFDCITRHLSTQSLGLLVVFARVREFVPHAVRLTHHRFRSDTLLYSLSHDRRIHGAMLSIWLLSHQQCVAAEQVFKGIIPGNEKASERDEDSNIPDLGILGAVYMSQGQLDRAKLIYDAALEKSKSIQAYNGIDYFLWAREVSYITYLRGDFRLAESMLQFLLEAYGNAYGPDNHRSVVIFADLIHVYNVQGYHKKASFLSSQVVGKYDKIVNKEAGFRSVCDYAELLHKSMRVLKGNQTIALEHFTRMLSILKERAYRKPGMFLCIGRALLFWEDWVNARFAYRYSVDFIDDRTLRFDMIECDGCDQELDVEVGLNVCIECADVDLCDTCLVEYRKGKLAPRGCTAHVFYSTDTKSLATSEDDVFEEVVDLWIDEMIHKYSALQFR